MGWLSAAGFVASLATVVCAGALGDWANAAKAGHWLGLTITPPPRGAPMLPVVVVLVVALVVLLAAWALLTRAAAAGAVGVRRLGWVAALWAAPMVVAPPVFSRDAFSYLAQGRLLARGFDPYRATPSALGPGRLLGALDVRWTHTVAPYGPLSLRVQEAAAVGGGDHVLLGVAALRAVAVVAVVLTVALAVRLVGPARRPVVVAAIGLNPIVLVHVVGGAHIDGWLAVLVVAALLAELRGRPMWAMVAATAAFEVKLTGAVVVVALAVAHLWRADPRSRLRALGRDALTVAVVAGLSALVVPDGLGWRHALATPGRLDTDNAPVSLLADLVVVAGRLVGAGATYDAVLPVTRTVGEVVAALLVVALLATARRRTVAATVGWALLAVAALGPVFYAWYVVPALACFAVVDTPVARRGLLLVTGYALLCGLPALRAGDPRWPATVLPLLGLLLLAAAGPIMARLVRHLGGGETLNSLRAHGGSQMAGNER